MRSHELRMTAILGGLWSLAGRDSPPRSLTDAESLLYTRSIGIIFGRQEGNGRLTEKRRKT